MPAPHDRPSLRFRERSVFDGVARREVGGLDLGAHSVAVLVPSLTALGSGLAFPRMVGPGFWVSTLLGFGLVALFVHVFNQYASRFSSAGTLYTFVAKGLGQRAALLVAGGLVVGYAAMIGFGLSDAAGRTDAALSSAGVDVLGGPWRSGVLFVGGAGLCLYALARGVRWSTRAALLAEVVSLGLLGVVLMTWLSRHGAPGWEVLSLEGASPTRILSGAAFIVTLTLAFESSASLGLETKQPIRTVPLALRSSLTLAAVLFALANAVATTRPADAPSVWSWRWFSPGAERSPVDGLVLLVLAWSLLALALCVWSALARLLFSLSREGVLPAWLGTVNARRTPWAATAAVAPLVLVPAGVAMAAGVDAGAFSWPLKESVGVVLCAGYASTAVALPLFLRRIDEVSPAPVVASVVAAAGAGAVAVAELVREVRAGSLLAVALVLVSVVLGLAMDRRARGLGTVASDRYVGMHDEALAASVVLPGESPGGEDDRGDGGTRGDL